VEEIRAAIMAGDTEPRAYEALTLPESYRGVTVRESEVGMFDGIPAREKDPRQPCTSTRCRCPNSGRARRSSP
jgi:crotonyl-CoA reductase